MSYGQRPEAIDARWIFRCYAVAATIGGLLLIAEGPAWLGTDIGGERWAKAALIRVFGSILAGAACCAEAMARMEGARERRKALLWFTAAHALVWLVMVSQQATIWGRGLGETATTALNMVVVLLLCLAATAEGNPSSHSLTTLFGSQGARPVEELRSEYEQRIREAARQEERNRLARDLHDSIKQEIFVVQTATATAQARFDADPGGAKEALNQVRGTARDAMAEMQTMLDQLRAVPLENTGLIAALRRQCEALGLRTGAKVEFHPGDLPDSNALPPGAHEALLRAGQEALANVARHARASQVFVSLLPVQGRVELRVKDDGAGFDPESNRRGQGIANMRARAEELGGVFEISGRPGAGTSIVFSVPYATTEPADVYRRRSLWAGGFSVLLAGMFLWPRRENPAFDWNIGLLCLLFGIGAARYAVAYRRVRGAAR